MICGTGVRLDTGFRGVLSCAGAAGGSEEEGEEGDVVDSLGRLCLVMRRRSVAEEGGMMTDEAVTIMMIMMGDAPSLRSVIMIHMHAM